MIDQLSLLAQTTTTMVESTGVLDELTSPSSSCGTDPSWACTWVYDLTGSKTWAGLADWFVAKPVSIIAILAVAFVVNRLLRVVVGRAAHRMTDPTPSRSMGRLRARTPAVLLKTEDVSVRAEARAQTLTTVGRSLATGLVAFVAFIAILQVLGVDLGPLLAGAGILGVALGFGAQTMVRDYLNGFFLVLEDQYGVGDVVDLGPDARGVVEKVTFRSTRLRAVNGTVWHVPNGEILRVGNETQDFAHAVIDVQVALDADLDGIEDLVHDTADGLVADPAWASEVLGPPDLWGIDLLTREGATVRLLIKVRPGAQWRVQREMRRRLKTAFDARRPDRHVGRPTGAGQLRLGRRRPTSSVGDDRIEWTERRCGLRTARARRHPGPPEPPDESAAIRTARTSPVPTSSPRRRAPAPSSAISPDARSGGRIGSLPVRQPGEASHDRGRTTTYHGGTVLLRALATSIA